jgi:hypothetical protein
MERVSIFMNKKDLKTLSESYGKIFEKTISNILKENHDEIMINADPQQEVGTVGIPSTGIDSDLQLAIPSKESDNDDKQMVIANLKTLVAHAQKALSIIQTGKCLEAWMNDKVSVATNDIVQVANALEFGD